MSTLKVHAFFIPRIVVRGIGATQILGVQTNYFAAFSCSRAQIHEFCVHVRLLVPRVRPYRALVYGTVCHKILFIMRSDLLPHPSA